MPYDSTEGNSDGMVRMKERLGGLETEEGRLKGFRVVTRPDDVFIVTSPKAGTTWTQQIVHQLRCLEADYIDQKDSFDEISCVVPFIEMAHDVGIDVNAEQVVNPRVFKTHAWYPHCPKGSRYIWVVRDPVDTAWSFFNFFQGWFFEPGEVTLDQFLQEFVLARGEPASEMNNASYWHNLISWWPHRQDPNVLMVFFEDMKADLPGTVSRIANFLGWCKGDEAKLEEAVQKSSFEYMKEHDHQFDEHLLKRMRNPHCGLPPEAGFGQAKVREGTTGAGKEKIPEEILEQFKIKWKQVEEVTGFATYADMRNACGIMNHSNK